MAKVEHRLLGVIEWVRMGLCCVITRSQGISRNDIIESDHNRKKFRLHMGRFNSLWPSDAIW